MVNIKTGRIFDTKAALPSRQQGVHVEHLIIARSRLNSNVFLIRNPISVSFVLF